MKKLFDNMHLFVVALLMVVLGNLQYCMAQKMTMERTGTGIKIQWPATASKLILQYTTNLSTANWNPVPGVNSADTSCLIPQNYSGNAFYRLIVDSSPDTEPAIRALLAAMKSRAEAHDVNGFLALFASDYMHFAENLTELRENIQEAIPAIRTFDWAVSNIVVNGDLAQVQGAVTITFSDGKPSMVFTEPAQNDNSPGFGWLKKTANGWMVHGNQIKASASISTSFNGTFYEFRMSVDSSLTITSVKVTGPNIAEKYLTYDSEWNSFTGWTTPSAPPAIGTAYTFEVHFSDGTQQFLNSTIRSYVAQAPGPITVTPGNGTAKISWKQIIPTTPNANGYWIWIYDSFGNMWRSDDDNYITDNTLTIDGSVLGFPLVSGRSYNASVYFFNEEDDFSSSGTSFVMP
jgi:hypothetical protein